MKLKPSIIAACVAAAAVAAAGGAYAVNSAGTSAPSVVLPNIDSNNTAPNGQYAGNTATQCHLTSVATAQVVQSGFVTAPEISGTAVVNATGGGSPSGPAASTFTISATAPGGASWTSTPQAATGSHNFTTGPLTKNKTYTITITYAQSNPWDGCIASVALGSGGNASTVCNLSLAAGNNTKRVAITASVTPTPASPVAAGNFTVTTPPSYTTGNVSAATGLTNSSTTNLAAGSHLFTMSYPAQTGFDGCSATASFTTTG